MTDYVSSLPAEVKAKNPAEPELHQAVQEVAESLALVLDRHPEYRHARILERIIEPERMVMFRVPWQDGQGTCRSTAASAWRLPSASAPRGNYVNGANIAGFLKVADAMMDQGLV